MTPFTSILAATDFSDDGNNAVRRAALLAHQHGAQLRILHVLKAAGCKPLREWLASPTIDIDLKAAQARDALRRVAVEISGAYDVSASVMVEVGDPYAILMQASERADLVVLGQRGRARLEGLLVRGTVDRMLRTCRRPILVVKTAMEGSYRRVLVPIDFTASSETAMAVAAGMPPDTGLHVFHAISSQRQAVLRDADVPEHIIRETRVTEEAGTNARMRRTVARLGLDSVRANFSIAHGPAARSILLRAQKLRADLIVAGKQGRSTVGGFLLGSVSSRLLAGSDCDILIVPRPRDLPLPRAQPDTAALARSAAHAGALSPVQRTRRATHFSPRRTS
jgi:nucleotide-binding universal stress UspA family protein